VARALGIGKAATVERLRKTQKRLLNGILRD
jgi:predicted DNA binding protein